jgi:hypothetical protein
MIYLIVKKKILKAMMRLIAFKLLVAIKKQTMAKDKKVAGPLRIQNLNSPVRENVRLSCLWGFLPQDRPLWTFSPVLSAHSVF